MTAPPDPSATDPNAIALVDGYPVVAPPLPRPHFFGQHWGDLTFVHWPVEPDSVAHLFPPGTRPDIFSDGMTYVALVPFAMSGLGFRASRSVPYFGAFLETNVWLYSIDDAGRHGLLFQTEEAARLAVVQFGRLFGYPYRWAKMRMTRSGDRITYHSARRRPLRRLQSRLAIVVGEVVEPTPLEVWLTARWGSHIRKAGRTWWLPTEHEPWVLRTAEIIELDDELLAAIGVWPAGPPLRALFSPGVRARFGRPARVR